jgi:hypothetical protein
LRLGQRGGKVQALVAHLAENEVGGAVDDAGHPFDAVGGQALAQRLDDRDAHGHRAFVGHGHALLSRGGKDLGSVHGQQRLVGRDHVLAVGDGGQHPVARGTGAAGHFHHHVDIGVGGDLHRVLRELHALSHDAGGPLQVARRDHHQFDRAACAGRDVVPVARQHAQGAGADGADADHPHAQGTGGRGMAVQGLEGFNGIAVHGLFSGQKSKTQLPELGSFFRGESDTRWLPKRPPARVR